MSDKDGEFTVTFWGVRGSLPCPGPNTRRYGGNTSCLEVRCGDRIIILDGGSGMRPLGLSLLKDGALDCDILYTHTHLDHVIGFPFFVPFFMPQNRFRLWAGHLMAQNFTLRGVLEMMLTAPLFPVPMDIMQAQLSFNDFYAGQDLDFGPDIKVTTQPLNHPNNATGYRIEYKGKAFSYVTDTEHYEGRRDETVLELIDGVDYFAYDATYTDEEYPKFKTWGHSTWQEACRLADEANAKVGVMFHHDPGHDDAKMDEIAKQAADTRGEGAIVAEEGMTLKLL